MDETFEGGCACGATRYRIERVFDVVYCHCDECRRRTGAPVSVVVVVPREAFEVTRGEPVLSSSSAAGSSYICGSCHTPLYFDMTESPYVSVTHGSLDKPGALPPRVHQWTAKALPWLKIDDDLPRFEGGQISHPDAR